MVRLSFTEIAVILLVVLVVFSSRARSARREGQRPVPKGQRWSPAVVTFVFALLIGGGFFFLKGIVSLLRMMKR